MPALSPTAVTALRAAHAAAAVHRRFFQRLERVDYKGGRRGQAAHTWLVDPLDGTSNYARGIAWFCVSIALHEQEAGVVLGVILNPIIGEVYAAERGRGAYTASLADLPSDAAAWGDLAPWRRLQVSSISALRDAGFATGFPSDVTESRVNIDHFVNVRLEASIVRALGSAALGLAHVAAGHLEGYWEIGPKAWDFGAGMVVVEEAGGRISDLRGRPLSGPGAGRLLATNGVIHDAMVEVLARGRSGLD